MSEELPVDLTVNQNSLPPQQASYSINTNFSVINGNLVYSGGRLRTFPKPVDKNLKITDPKQTFDDCRTIEGWTGMISKLLKAAWTKTDFTFTHDFALLENDPNAVKGLVIVYDVISEEPAKIGSVVERKPRPRQTSVDPIQGTTWVWGQQFDVMIAFTLYADSWSRLIDYTERFKAFMQTYTGIFKQLGLQELFFHGQMRDALYDPPHAQETPTRTIFYRAKIERLLNVNLSEIEQVLITAGVIDLLTGQPGAPTMTATISGIPPSPELPA